MKKFILTLALVATAALSTFSVRADDTNAAAATALPTNVKCHPANSLSDAMQHHPNKMPSAAPQRRFFFTTLQPSSPSTWPPTTSPQASGASSWMTM